MFDIPWHPEAATDYAQQIDYLYITLWGLTAFFTLVVAVLIFSFSLRFRKGSKADRSRPVHADHRVELIWTIIPLILGLSIFVWAAKLYAEVYTPPKDAMEVFVIGKQWMWHTQHGNGVRENNELHVPVGRAVKLTMISQDVIHSFFIPEFRIKRDVIPGKYNEAWFRATKPGRYRLLCSEYCGTQHSLMGGWITVMEPREFSTWLATGGSTSGTGGTAGTGAQTMEMAGAALFQEQGCVSCHGVGAVARCPNLAGIYGKPQQVIDGGSMRAVKADDAYIRESILYPQAKIVVGYQPLMNSYNGVLSEDQILQLIAFIRSIKDRKDLPALPQGGGPGRTTLGGGANSDNGQDAFIQNRTGAPGTNLGGNGGAAAGSNTDNGQNDFIQNR